MQLAPLATPLMLWLQVFYACPSVTVPAFFAEVADVSGSFSGAPGAVVQQLDAVAQLTRAVQVRWVGWAGFFFCSLLRGGHLQQPHL